MPQQSCQEKITLKSSEGEPFEVDQAVAVHSQIIQYVREDVVDYSVIPLPNVPSKILAKVIEYCKKHVDAANSEEKISDEDLKAWDANFVRVDLATFHDLMRAADYLEIKSLLDLTRKTVEDIKGKTPEEIVETFIIWNNPTPTEKEVGQQNQWVKDFPMNVFITHP